MASQLNDISNNYLDISKSKLKFRSTSTKFSQMYGDDEYTMNEKRLKQICKERGMY